MGPRIGIGSFGEVYRGSWRHTDVAVKRLLEQEYQPAMVKVCSLYLIRAAGVLPVWRCTSVARRSAALQFFCLCCNNFSHTAAALSPITADPPCL